MPTIADLLGTHLLLDYDASDASTLFEDAAGTNAAEDADVVLCWKPASGSQLATNLTVVANGPAYRADYSSTGYAALEFDGVNDRLGNASSGLMAVRFMALAVYTYISGTASTIWFRGSSLTDICRLLYVNGTSCQIQYGISSSYTTYLTPGSVSGKRCVATAFGANQTQIDQLGSCNGGQDSNSVSASLGAGLYVGAGENAGVYQPANAAIHEVVFVDGDCEWGKVLQCAKLLRTKWGITDPNGTPSVAAGGGGPLVGPSALISL